MSEGEENEYFIIRRERKLNKKNPNISIFYCIFLLIEGY